MRRPSWQERYLDRFYRKRREWTGGTAEFHRLCAAAVPEGGRILEIGAGPSNATSRFVSSLGELHGIDVSEEVLANDALISVSVLDQGSSFPFPADHFDACVSDYVLEHVEDPHAHFSEVSRVLRPGGTYVFRTPNRFHYVAVASRATPYTFHRLVANRLRSLPVGAHDPYPTFYRSNSRRTIHKLARSTRLKVLELRMVEKEPSYGMSSRLLFLLQMAYERLVNSTDRLACLRSSIFGTLQKLNINRLAPSPESFDC